MKNKLLTLLLFLTTFATASFGQATFGLPAFSNAVTLSLVPQGTGNGTITDNQGNTCTYSGGSASGCTINYTLNTNVSLTPNPGSSVTFQWQSGGSGSAFCAGSGFCTFTISQNSSATGTFTSTSGNPNVIPESPTIGLGYNASTVNCSNTNFPTTFLHGVSRWWDTSGVLWSFVETANKVFSWSTVDSELCSMASNQIHDGHIALARTPPFATAAVQYTDAGSCNYLAYATQNNANTSPLTDVNEVGTLVTVTTTYSPGNGNTVVINGVTPNNYNGVFTVTCDHATGCTNGFQYTNGFSGLGDAGSGGSAGVPSNMTNSGPGQCDPPSDLNSNVSGSGQGDGAGANQYWRDWIGGLASHVNQPGYLNGTSPFTQKHSHMRFYETWNEPDTPAFWSGANGNGFGSYDGLIRLQQDAYCILKGGAQFVPGIVSTGTFAQGTVTTSSTGNKVTSISGTQFTTGGAWTGATIVINGTPYVISVVNTSVLLTLTTSPGNQGPVLYSEQVIQSGTGSVANLIGGPVFSTDMLNFWTTATGSPNSSGVWTSSLNSATYTPTAAPSTMTIRATGETCLQVRTAVSHATSGTNSNVVNTSSAFWPNFPTAPLDPSATVVMPSYHGPYTSSCLGQSFLYCGTGEGTHCSNTPNSACHVGGFQTAEAMNYHFKPFPQSNTVFTPFETTESGWMTNVQSTFKGPELLKPFFGTEGGATECGWPEPTGSAQCVYPNNPWGRNQMEAAGVAAYYIYSYFLGLTENVWYDWDPAHNGAGGIGTTCVPPPSGTGLCAMVGYNTINTWMVGAILGTCSQSNGAGTNSLFTCTITNQSGAPAQIMWDNADLCTGGTNNTEATACPSQSRSVAGHGYTKYYLLVTPTTSPVTIGGGNTVPVGIVPILVE